MLDDIKRIRTRQIVFEIMQIFDMIDRIKDYVKEMKEIKPHDIYKVHNALSMIENDIARAKRQIEEIEKLMRNVVVDDYSDLEPDWTEE